MVSSCPNLFCRHCLLAAKSCICSQRLNHQNLYFNTLDTMLAQSGHTNTTKGFRQSFGVLRRRKNEIFSLTDKCKKSGILVCQNPWVMLTQKCTCLDFKWRKKAKKWICKKLLFFLFLVNLTEREHSQGQTWGETAVTVGIEEEKKQKQQQKSQ